MAKICWNCETVEVEPDEFYCSTECWKETTQGKDLPMPTFVYCKECKKLYDKNLGCSTCEAQMYYE